MKKKLKLVDHCSEPRSVGKVPVEIDTNKGQVWLLFGKLNLGDGRPAISVEHYEGQLVARIYRAENEEPQERIVLIPDVDEYLNSKVEWSISLADSGDLVKDGFKSEAAAYKWLRKRHGEDITGYVVEESNRDD